MSYVSAIVTAVGTLASLVGLCVAIKHQREMASGRVDRAMLESIPRWSIWLFERWEGERYEREWRAHIWELIEEEEIKQAWRDRLRFAIAGPAIAISLRIRQRAAQQREPPKITNFYLYAGVDVKSTVMRAPGRSNLYDLKIEARNQRPCELFAWFEICQPRRATKGYDAVRTHEILLRRRGCERRSGQPFYMRLHIDRDVLSSPELQILVFQRSPYGQNHLLLGRCNVQLP